MVVPLEHHDTRELERERDDLVRRLLNCEAEFNQDGAISRQKYLQTRKTLEQRLIHVMNDLTRLEQGE